MANRRNAFFFTCAAWLLASVAAAQAKSPSASSAELRLRIVSSLTGVHASVPAVAWIDPVEGTPVRPFVPHGVYTLLQKNRTFVPHLQVIPAGSVVQFPNADPFFHNVFSLFDGQRFDLGLYEAGSSRSVTFSRVGVSYIFCNIHPEMSAIVLALATPLYALADADESIVIRGIPAGNYILHFWIEGVPQPVLNGLEQHVHLPVGATNLGDVMAPIAHKAEDKHLNKFGAPYDTVPDNPY